MQGVIHTTALTMMKRTAHSAMARLRRDQDLLPRNQPNKREPKIWKSQYQSPAKERVRVLNMYRLYAFCS